MKKNITRIGLEYDKKNRMIYINQANKKIYVIDEVNLRKFEFFHNRYLFSFTLFLLISIMNPYVALAVGLLSVLILEFVFRNMFLSKCRTLETFTPTANSNIKIKNGFQLIILSILYILLGSALIYSTFTEQGDSQTTILLYGVAAYAFYGSFSNIKRYIKSKK